MSNSDQTPFVLVVQDSRSCALRIMLDIKEVYPASKLRLAMDLSDAYNVAEHRQPDLVILDHKHVADTGLDMFLSLLSALAIDWVIIGDGARNRLSSNGPQVTIEGLKTFLETKWLFKIAAGRSPVASAGASMSSQCPQTSQNTGWASGGKTVVIGASTGGIEALIEVLSCFSADAPPTVVVQHIQASFLPGLADRLDRICAPNVRVAQDTDMLTPGQVLLAPGDTEHLVIAEHARQCRLQPGPPLNGHRPSVDALFSSAAQTLGPRCIGVLLSGMGRDGAAGLLEIRQNGGWTIAQDEATCTVYGMPRAAVKTGAVIEQHPLSKIGPAVLRAISRKRQKAPYA